MGCGSAIGDGETRGPEARVAVRRQGPRDRSNARIRSLGGPTARAGEQGSGSEGRGWGEGPRRRQGLGSEGEGQVLGSRVRGQNRWRGPGGRGRKSELGINGDGDGGEGRSGVWDEGRGARAGVRRAKVRPGAEGQGPRQGSGVSGRSGGPKARSGVRREGWCRSRLRDRGPGSWRRLRRVRGLGGGRQAVGIPLSSGGASQPRPPPPRPFAALRRALDRAAALASSGRPPPLRPRPRRHSAPTAPAPARLDSLCPTAQWA